MAEPTYLPLLNSIAVNEAKGEILLNAWADATRDKALACTSAKHSGQRLFTKRQFLVST